MSLTAKYSDKLIPVMEPSFTGNEALYVNDCLKSGWVSSRGEYIGRFEVAFAKVIGARSSLACSNGTTALHLALLSLGVGPGDEVIVPDLTFAATINTVLHAGATPVIVDVEPDTWNISPAAIQDAITPATKAIIPVHLYGQACRMDEILEIAHANRLYVIEDCAESIGTEYKGQKVGSFGDVGCFSFYGNKIITTGEGGMLLFKSEELRERAWLYANHGMSKAKRYWHDVVGYNYRMTNIQAAIGLAQLEQLSDFISKHRQIASWYQERFTENSRITCPTDMSWSKHVFWLYTILVDLPNTLTREILIKQMLECGIETRPMFYPLHQMPIYREYTRNMDCPVSASLSNRGLSLPSSVMLSECDVDLISKQLIEMISAYE